MSRKSTRIVCKFSSVWGSREQSITVDLEEGTVCIENCHKPRKLFAGAEGAFTCPLGEILAAFDSTNTGDSSSNDGLHITTAQGGAFVPENASNYSELADLLSEIASLTPGPPAVATPWMGALYFIAIVGCMVGGPMLLWPSIPAVSLAALVWLSLGIGVAVCPILRFGVTTVERNWEVKIVIPLVCAPLLALLSVFVANLLGIAWNTPWNGCIAVAGAAAGAVVGVFEQRRRDNLQPTDPSGGLAELVAARTGRPATRSAETGIGADSTSTKRSRAGDSTEVVASFRGMSDQVQRVVVDLQQRTVRFENCHAPRKFLARTSPVFECSLDEILDVHIHTPMRTGTARRSGSPAEPLWHGRLAAAGLLPGSSFFQRCAVDWVSL